MWRFANRFSFVPTVVNDHSRWTAIGFAIFISGVSVWISNTFWSYTGEGKTHTMLPLAAVFISAIAGGLVPGIISAFASTLALAYLLDPAHSFTVATWADRIWLGIYLLLSLGAVWLGSVLKSVIQSEKKSSEKLENEVKARTAELTTANQELRRVLVEMEESRTFLDAVIESIPLSIYVKTADGLKMTKVNRAARESLEGISDFIGKTASDLLPEESARRVTAGDLEALTTGSLVRREETVRDRSGRVRVFSTNRVPVLIRNGKPAYIVGISEEITEKKRTEEQGLKLKLEQAAREEAERKKWELEEAVRARDTFLSICSHELKTPLTSLKLQTGVIRMLFEKSDIEALRSPKVRELVMDADKEIDRINRLINDMLDVSRIRSGKLTLHPGKVDLCDVVREVVGHFKSIPAYESVEITTQLPHEAIGEWDRNRIEQIVINLVSNALKYGHQKPIRVIVQANESTTSLAVEDQGVGISPEDQKRIFQRFERAAATESISGLGLGLYIVKEIVTMHGGNILVKSERGKGSQFTVELPTHFTYATRSAQAA